MKEMKPNIVTADEDPYSGSKTYVYGKTPAEAGLAFFRASEKLIDIPQTWLAEPWLAPAKQFWSLWQNTLSTFGNKALLNQFMHTPLYAQGMVALGRALPADTEVNEKLNYRFFTHNRFTDDEKKNGSLNEITAEQIASYFPPNGDSQKWPNLILTSSHALAKSHHDISGIMKGVHALVRDLFAGDNGIDSYRLRLLEREDNSGQTPGEGKPSILISSVFNDHNAWVNGGSLLLRLHHLDTLYESEQHWRADGGAEDAARRTWREKAYLGQGDTAMSPASIRLAKLMMALIVETPDQIHIPSADDFERWGNDLTQSYNKQPLILRADARDVLQHIKLVGYSKGGNIISDALRYVSMELQRDHAQGKLVQLHDELDGQLRDIKPEDVKALLMNTGALAINPGITPLTDYEKECGLRRLSVRNPEDWITAHLFERHRNKEVDGTNDDIFEIHPEKRAQGLGHAPEDALGNMDKGIRGYLTDKSRMQSDEARFDEMYSRLKCFLASCHGKSGIKSMHMGKDGQCLHLEFSAGASKADTEQVKAALEKTLRPKLSGAGRVLEIEHDWHKGCEMIIHAPASAQRPDGAANMNQPPSAERLKKAVGESLLELEKNNVTFVGHNVYSDLLVAPPTPERSIA